jgi:hypothetical protein
MLLWLSKKMKQGHLESFTTIVFAAQEDHVLVDKCLPTISRNQQLIFICQVPVFMK